MSTWTRKLPLKITSRFDADLRLVFRHCLNESNFVRLPISAQKQAVPTCDKRFFGWPGESVVAGWRVSDMPREGSEG